MIKAIQENEQEQDRTMLMSDSTEFDGDVVAIPESQSRSKRKLLAGTAALALLGVIMYAASRKSGPSFLSSDIKRAVQLDETAAPPSKFYVVKHTFKSKEDVKTYWEAASNLDYGPLMEAMHDAVYDSKIAIPLAEEGPIYCVFEQKAGMSKDDAQEYVDKWIKEYMGVEMNNEVMPLAFPPYKSFFAADEADSSRRLGGGKKAGPIFYLQEMVIPESVSQEDVDETLTKMEKMSWDKWVKDGEGAGFHDNMCIAVEGGKLNLEVIDAKPGVTASDIEGFTSKWLKDNQDVTTYKLKAHKISNELVGGAAGWAAMGFKHEF